jgi:hypothetical protein
MNIILVISGKIGDFKKMSAVTRAETAESFFVSPLKAKRQSALLLILNRYLRDINFLVHIK